MFTKHLKKQQEVATMIAGIEQMNKKLDEIGPKFKEQVYEAIADKAASKSYVDKNTGLAVISLFDLDLILFGDLYK